jgi:cell division septation protein DedD
MRPRAWDRAWKLRFREGFQADAIQEENFVSFFNRKKPDEFISEMPEYDDEEYYGEEEGEYAEDGEYDEDYEEEDDAAPAPKKSVVKTALFGVAALVVVGALGYYAANTFAPEMTQELVNNLPFVHHDEAAQTPGGDQFTDVPGNEAAKPPAEDGQVAPPPEDVTASSDVAAVPPVPPKPQPVKPHAAKPKAHAKPKPVKVAEAPAEMMQQPAAPKPAAKPAPKKWAPKKWTPKPAARAWAPKTAWKPRATSRYARYYSPRARYSRYASAYRTAAYGRYRTARAYSGYGRGRYGAWSRARYRYARGYYAPRYRTARAYKATRTAYAAPSGRYAVQVGSFSDSGNAQQLVSQLRAQGINAYMSGGGGTAMGSGQVVRSVGVRSRTNARRLLAQYRAAGYPARIVSLGNGMMAVSAGVYGSADRAQAVVASLNQRGLYATTSAAQGVRTAGGGMARVYIGAYGSRGQAAAKMRQLQQQGIPAAVTTR